MEEAKDHFREMPVRSSKWVSHHGNHQQRVSHEGEGRQPSDCSRPLSAESSKEPVTCWGGPSLVLEKRPSIPQIGKNNSRNVS